MKILFNSYYHAFQNPGGGEIVLKKTREALQKRGITVDLFDQWNTKISDYDLIHNFSMVNYRDFDGLKAYAGKLAVTPVMWPDISLPHLIKERIKKIGYNLLDHNTSEVNFHKALSSVDHFFPTTNMEWNRIVKRYKVKAPHKVIYNGVDAPTNPTRTFSEQFKIKDYILYVGRISPLKNIHSIIEASLLAGQKLVIIGGSDLKDRDYEKKLRERNSDNPNILFTGALPHNSPTLNDAYFEAKALIVASQFETCSLTGLEAGIRSIPVVMTESGATKEVYRDLVSYINPNDVKDIAEKLGQSFCKDQSEKLKHFIFKHYSWAQIAEELSSEYLEIMKR